MVKDNSEQDYQTVRSLLPATFPKEKAAELTCKIPKQWIMLAVVTIFIVVILWATLSDGCSQSGELRRPASSVNQKSYQRTPSNAVSSPGHKILMEGHWLGMEVGPITSDLTKNLGIPPSVKGVLVDEVTLLSAEQGLLAGDIVVSIAGQDTEDLHQFLEASKKVRSSKKVTITAFRQGRYLNVPIRSNSELGFAQMEAAPMIQPTDLAPHRYYGPCTNCHTIGNTGQLAVDLGDTIRRPLPAIRDGTPAPHRDRGACANCHKILDGIFAGHDKIGVGKNNTPLRY